MKGKPHGCLGDPKWFKMDQKMFFLPFFHIWSMLRVLKCLRSEKNLVGDLVCKFDPFWMSQIIWLTRDREQLALECDEREKKISQYIPKRPGAHVPLGEGRGGLVMNERRRREKIERRRRRRNWGRRRERIERRRRKKSGRRILLEHGEKKDWTPPLVYFGIGESKWKIREQKRNSKSRTKTWKNEK